MNPSLFISSGARPKLITLLLVTVLSSNVFASGPPARNSKAKEANSVGNQIKSAGRSAVDGVKGMASSAGDFLGGMMGCDPAEKADQAAEAKAPADTTNRKVLEKEINENLQAIDAQCKTALTEMGPSNVPPAYPVNKFLKCQLINDKNLVEGLNEFLGSYESCHSSQNTAASICLECNNGSLAGSLSTVNGLLSVAGASGVADACSTMGKAMNIASTALTAFSTACTAVKSGCALTCRSANKGLEKIKKWKPQVRVNCVGNPNYSNQGEVRNACERKVKALEISLNRIEQAITKELANDIKLGTVGGKYERCWSEYGKIAVSAIAGAAQMLNHKKQADACEKETRAEAVAAAAALDCNDAKNANNTECICKLNPRNAGCSAAAADYSGSDFDGRLPSNVGGSTNTDIPKINANAGGSGASDLLSAAGDGRSPRGGAGMAAGGGGGGFGGGSGGGGDAGAAAAAGPGEALPEYGDMGVGGGGGGSWDSGAGYAAEESELEQYLPGGEGDPNANMAGLDFPTDVTTEAGKSNWEKVRERYSERHKSLLGN